MSREKSWDPFPLPSSNFRKKHRPPQLIRISLKWPTLCNWLSLITFHIMVPNPSFMIFTCLYPKFEPKKKESFYEHPSITFQCSWTCWNLKKTSHWFAIFFSCSKKLTSTLSHRHLKTNVLLHFFSLISEYYSCIILVFKVLIAQLSTSSIIII